MAGGQEHEVRYKAKKAGGSTADVKRAVNSVRDSRKKVDQKLGK